MESSAFIALGSNLNLDGVSSLELIKKAITELEKSNFNLQAISRFFKNPAFPIGSGPDFVNAVVKVRIDAKPQNIWINCILLKKNLADLVAKGGMEEH